MTGWLQRSKVFVLTSRSEGLALSLMEAMMAGLPAVVSRVGDLGDLVEHGRNGYLIDSPSPDDFAAAILPLLVDGGVYQEFSRAALNSAVRYSVEATTRKWDAILGANEQDVRQAPRLPRRDAHDPVIG